MLICPYFCPLVCLFVAQSINPSVSSLIFYLWRNQANNPLAPCFLFNLPLPLRLKVSLNPIYVYLFVCHSIHLSVNAPTFSQIYYTGLKKLSIHKQPSLFWHKVTGNEEGKKLKACTLLT